MVAITLSNLSSLTNETSAISTINNNSTAITDAFEDCLSINDTTSNVMAVDLNMNSNNLLNLPYPASATEPVRLEDLSGLVASYVTTNDTLTFGSPTTKVGLSVVTGTAATAMHSDGAPQLDVSISPTWTGTHTFSNSIVPSNGFSFGTGAKKTISITSANVGYANTFEAANSGTYTTSGTLAEFIAILTNGTNVFAALSVSGAVSPTALLQSGGGVTGGFTISAGAGTLTITNPTLTTPTLTFGTGSAQTIVANSANTGFQSSIQATNAGTLSNSSTEAGVYSALSAGTNVYLGMTVTGGASPIAGLTSGGGATGGLNIASTAGQISITANGGTGTINLEGTPVAVTGTLTQAGTNFAVDANGILNTSGFSRVTSTQTYTSNAAIANIPGLDRNCVGW